MNCKLFVFRHAETTDNARMLFSGWRDPDLTPRGYKQAEEVAEQLSGEEIDYAFTSHLKRARKTLEIVLRKHPSVLVFVDDRLIERCYGLLQGKSKKKLQRERPEWFAEIHRGYDAVPPEGESIRMVEQRTMPFMHQLREWLQRNPGNVAISCHGNSMRPIRRLFEQLSVKQMLQIENPQDKAVEYVLQCHEVFVEERKDANHMRWEGELVPNQVRLATDP
ncbi:MAG: histidine phosphatase family protein, partial [Candidatus Bathyarchaeia archaeon]